jgi:uncharacterized membrane-anchored protein
MSKTSRLTEPSSNLPKVVALFWVIKITTTGMGEAASDFLVRTLGNFPAVALGTIIFSAALLTQFRLKGFSRWVYWLTVAMVSVFGTMAADIVHIGFDVPYLASTIFFFVALVVTFTLWWRFEGTISIATVDTKRREFFYWLTVLITFALGTAAGDMTARTFGWGYLSSGLIFGLAFAIPLIAYVLGFRFRTIWFWLAYIATRPFGASFADWIGADHNKGGLGFGFGNITLVLAAVIFVLVAISSRTNKAA